MKITNTRSLQASLALAVAALALAGCAASPSYPITDAARVSAGQDNPAPPTAADFPDAASAKWQQGSFPSLDALRRMNTGMGKDQVRELLSWPHFSEGIAGVREWNYLFHFRTGKGAEILTCQYMVRFNNNVLTHGLYWKTPECAALLAPPAAAPVAAAAAAVPTQKITLGADGLFRFDGGTAADLLPAGRRKIEALAQDIRRDFKVLRSVQVTGHTDRIGKVSYNERLSQLRADTVRDLLVQQGIDRPAIRTAGMGARQPVASCEGQKATPALVACLQPNRRVDIEVDGER